MDRTSKTRAKLRLQVNQRLDFETQQSVVIECKLYSPEN